MAELVWGAQGERLYERGVSRGVLYVDEAVPWSGIISIDETLEGATATALYFDGITYYNLVGNSDFRAQLKAFSAPKEFDRCDGILELAPGLFADQQRRDMFGLSYRTEIGSDLVANHAYKIHLVYGCTAVPSTRNNQTESDKPAPSELEWEISTVPPRTSALMKPTAHLIVNSLYTNPAALVSLEEALYGSSSEDAYLPDIPEVIDLLTV